MTALEASPCPEVNQLHTDLQAVHGELRDAIRARLATRRERDDARSEVERLHELRAWALTEVEQLRAQLIGAEARAAATERECTALRDRESIRASNERRVERDARAAMHAAAWRHCLRSLEVYLIPAALKAMWDVLGAAQAVIDLGPGRSTKHAMALRRLDAAHKYMVLQGDPGREADPDTVCDGVFGELRRLRKHIHAHGAALHADRDLQGFGGPVDATGRCRCPGCELIRDMDDVPAPPPSASVNPDAPDPRVPAPRRLSTEEGDQPRPRRWAVRRDIPAEPGPAVQAVRDGDDDVWWRHGDAWRMTWRDGRELTREWRDLVFDYGPLVDVTANVSTEEGPTS